MNFGLHGYHLRPSYCIAGLANIRIRVQEVFVGEHTYHSSPMPPASPTPRHYTLTILVNDDASFVSPPGAPLVYLAVPFDVGAQFTYSLKVLFQTLAFIPIQNEVVFLYHL